MKVPKSKKTLRDIRKELKEIYDDSGEPMDMTALSRRKPQTFGRKIIKAIIFLFLLSAVSWSGFFLFSRGFFQKNDTLSVNIEGPQEIKGGDAVTYAVRYENKGSVPIAALEMSASLPPSFELLSSTPDVSDKKTWKIGSLTPHSDGVITLNGRFISEVPSSEHLQVLFTYKPANFNSEFQTIQTKKIEVTDSVLNLEATGPQQAVAGDELVFTTKVTNTFKDPLGHMRLVPNPSPDFQITSQEPAFEKDKAYWNLAELKPNEPQTFTLKGHYTVSAAGVQNLAMQIGFVKDDAFIKQKEQLIPTQMQGGAIAFHLIINGSDQDQNIQAGKIVRASIDFSNQGDETAQNVSFQLNLDGGGKTLPINWNKADLADGKRSGNTITWDKQTTGLLKNIKPEDTGAIDLSLPIVSNPNGSMADTIFVKLITSMDRLGDNTDPKSVESNPVKLTFDSNTSFSADARYFLEDGQPIGSGPLPPSVGQSTTYRVFFHISNSLHELKNVEVTTSLPSSVTWVDKKQAAIGNVSFNATTRTVKWKADKIPSSISEADAWFDVSIKPTSSDVGKFVKLTGTSAFTATDSKTNSTISQSVESFTTDLTNDDGAKGKGTVTK